MAAPWAGRARRRWADMTSLLPPSTRPDAVRPRASAAELRRDLRIRRPLTLVAVLGGALAAAGPLLVCMAVALTGWFLTDAGGHGAPRDALRIGALGWLMAHGSGVHVQGTLVTVMPLGLTLVSAWATWRLGLRVGDAISGHGPTADRIADGERDWTVPVASLLFFTGYAVTAVVTGMLATTTETSPDLTRVLLWCVVLCGVIGGPAIAVGSGRAAIWTATLPAVVVAAAAAFRQVLRVWVAVAAVTFLVAFVLDFTTALNVMSQLHAGARASVLIGVVCVVVAPNAAVFSGSYLLGPGFTVGAHTIVSPAVVSIGALPMFPLLAALPDAGPTPAWTSGLIALPPVVAAVGAVLAQRRHVTYRYEEGALHGGAGGILAGAAFAVLAVLAGGAVGPGRMSDVGPLAFSVLLHAMTSFGIGGILGGLAMTWWQRRGVEFLDEDDEVEPLEELDGDEADSESADADA